MRSSKDIKDELWRVRRAERNYEKKLAGIRERIIELKAELIEALNYERTRK